MEERECAILDNNIIDNYDRKLDEGIVSSILLYVYGEPKTTEQISRNLNLVTMKTQYYLNYMVDKGYLDSKKSKVVEGIVDNTYEVSEKVRNSQMKIDSEGQLAIQAKRFANILEKQILSMRKGNICGTKITVATLDKKSAQIILDKMNEINELMETLEAKCMENNTKDELSQYQFVSSLNIINED